MTPKNYFSRLLRRRPVSHRQHEFRSALRQLAPVELLEDRRLLAAWDLSATLMSGTIHAESQEGYSVAAGSEYYVTGKPFAYVNGLVDSGAVEVFEAATNTHIATLSRPSPFSSGRFGHSVAVSGNTIVVGALGDAGSFGRAYVYKVDNGSVVLESAIDNPTPAGGDEFGATVAISGDLIVVGAPRDDTTANNAGSVYVYDQSTSLTTPVATLSNTTGAVGDLYGSSVAVDGDTIVIGALLDDTGAVNAGKAYVYTVSVGTVTPLTSFNNPTPAAGDLFGSSVAVSGDTIVVGAYSDDTGASGAGSAYIFDISSGAATPYATVHNPEPNSADLFGISVAISGRTLVIGSHLDDGTAPDAGSAYVYQLNAGTVTLLDTIENPYPGPGDQFGFSVGVNDNTIVVGASQKDGQYVNQGAAYVFLRVNTPPTALALSFTLAAENLPAGTLVGSLSSTDLDLDDTFAYSLVAGGGDADNASFEVVGDTLVTAGSFDFEAQQNYSVRLRTTDQGGLFHEQVLAISVTNVNENPVVTEPIFVTATEDDADLSVDLLTGASDPEIVDTLAVENVLLIAGDSSGIIVNGNNLDVSPATYNSLNAGESRVITYAYDIVDGNGGVTQQSATISITGQNDAPVAVDVTGAANEDGPSATITADYNDADASDTHTFSVDTTGTRGNVTNNSDGTFTYDPNGAFEFLTAGQTATDSFTYTVSDGNGGVGTATVTITVAGQNSPIDLNGVDQAGDNFAATFTEDGGPVLIQDLDLAGDGASIVTGPIGNEFQVNTFTTGRQELLGWTGGRSVATDHSGNYMIVWSSYQQDGSEAGVYAQRYNADGTAAGAEFRVNSYTNNDQTYHSVAMDAVGNAVVVWTSTLQDGSGYGIYAQRYDASGAVVGGEFRVNTYTGSHQAYPSVAMRASGEFVVAWSSLGQDGDNQGIFAQQFNESGVTIGGELQVNTYTAGQQGLPSVAISHAGDFVIAWQSPAQDGSDFGVFARRFTAAGTPAGNEFGVNSFTNGRQAEPSVAMDSAGNFTIVWTSLDQDGSAFGIFGQRFDMVGSTVGNEFQVNSYTDSHQLLPSIAMTPSGNAVVTWMSAQGANANEVAAQQYDASGGSVGGELRINSYRAGSQDHPSVAITPSGDFIVAWNSDDQDGSNGGIFAQRFAGDFVSTPNIDFATIAITNPLDGSDELLAVDTTGTNIVAGFSAGVLTLSGSDTPAKYQQVLRTAAYDNTSQAPNTSDRLIEFSYSIASIASQPSTTTVSVVEENDLPTIEANFAAVVVNEGETATNAGAFGDIDHTNVSLSANVGTVLDQGNGTWRWSLPTQDGAGDTQSVIITATDGSNATSEVTFGLTIENVAPFVSNIDLTPSIDENGTATISGVLSDPGLLDTHTVEVSWGDGTTETVSLTNAITALAPVSDTVGRDDDLDGTYEFLENDAFGVHKFELMPDRERRFAMEFDLSEFSPADTLDSSILSLYRVGGTPPGLATIEVFGYSGDGSVSAADMNAGYRIAGPFTDSAEDLAAIDITSFLQSQIHAGATHAGIVLRSVVVERQTQLASSNNLDPALRPQLNIQFANRHRFSAMHQYLDDPQSAGDIVNVSVTATDDDGGMVTETGQLVVNNVAPILDNLSLTTSMNSSGFVTFSGVFPGAIIDPGTLDTHSVSIDFGDGSPPESIHFGTGFKSFTIPHQYSRVGSYSPELTLSDDDGGSRSVSLDPVEIVGYVTTSARADGNETGTAAGRFTIQQSVASDTDTIVNFSLAGLALEGVDYASIPHSVTIVAGTRSTIVQIPVHDDTLEEGYETVTLSLGAISAASGSVQLSVTGQSTSIGILDNDPDDDTDGVGDPVEAQAPNGGDGNSDGIPDSEQTYVTSLPNAVDGSYVTVVVAAASGGPIATLTQVTTNPNPSPDDAPDVDFPNGFVDYQIEDVAPAGAVTVTLIFDSTQSYTSYWKYGPTSSNTSPHWYEFLFDGTTGAVINGNEITLHFVDGARGDDDLLANGTIVDPGAPSGPPVANTGQPRANAGGPYYAAEGSQLTLDGSRTSHPSQIAESLTYEWDLDYNSTTSFEVEATGIRPVISFSDNFSPRKIALRVTDAVGNSHISQTTLQVLNVAPQIGDIAVELDENSGVGSYVATLVAIDPGSDSPAYSIVGGSGAEAFSIDSSSGIITIANSSMLDYESVQQLTLLIEATDGDGGRDTAEVAVSLLNQASISGVVFVDIDEDGSYEANEFGLDGVQLTLHDGTGNPVLDAHGEAITALTGNGGFYLFDDLDPGIYQIREMQPDGVTDGGESLGSAGGSILGNDIMQLSLSRTDAYDYAFAEIGSQVTSGDSASIGFWQNKHGQSLIASGGNSLAQWLTTSFSNVFGDSLAGASSQQVADFYREELFRQKSNGSTGPAKMDAQFMATAMSVYFTNRNLAGDVATGYGFTVSQTGLGSRAVNIGSSGEAFNAANNSTLTVMQALQATNGMTDASNELVGFASTYDLNGDGILDNHERRLRLLAHQVYGTINQ